MISNLKVNNMSNPFGIEKDINFSFIADEGEKFIFHLLNDKREEVYTKEITLEEAIGFKIDFPFSYGKKYYFQISSENETSELGNFFVADQLDASFISTNKEITHPVFFKDFKGNDIKSARLVITGLGLYQAFINKEKVGDAYLTPGFNDYDEYLRYQEYDISNLIKESNRIEVIVGDGWYKGRMGFDNHPGNIWGDTYQISAKIILVDSEDKEIIIPTDESWKAHRSEFVFSTIYDGEVRDATIDQNEEFATFVIKNKYNLVPQFNPLIKEEMRLKPELIVTPLGEKVLDFKQNMVGFVSFKNKTPKGNVIHLQYGEILQNGNFYRENLRSAKAELIYTSNGDEAIVSTMFSFYGFRYVKVEGIENIDVDDFDGVVIHTELENTLECTTSNSKINQLIKNAMWGQRGNFLDVPTDCPQRDERLGWTGDTQVFAGTASMNMNTKLFYKKFMRDLRCEQVRYYNGDIPCYAPSLKGAARPGGAVWADVATILPMKVFESFGDLDLLKEDYLLMKDYVESLISNDIATGNKHLVSNGFTFGDWLAMDGITPQSRKGGTEDFYIQSMYFYYSLSLVARAAKELNNKEDEEKYTKYSLLVKDAIINEYFTPSGRLSIDTQTAYILSLYFNVYVNKERVIEGLKKRLEKDMFTMKSGFVGAPLAITTLLDNGLDDYAFRILFSEKCPGWLFSINLGATTIWERWNSVLEDGSISGTGMNSLNHYAYGSVCEAIYTRIAGLKNIGKAWDKVCIEPHINYRLKQIDLTYKSVRGEYHVDYKINEDNSIVMKVKVPHGCKATIVLPLKENDNIIEVEGGEYLYNYQLTKDMNHPYNMFSSFIDILENPDAIKACCKHPMFIGIAQGDQEMSILSPFVLTQMGFLPVSVEQAKEIDEELRKVKA